MFYILVILATIFAMPARAFDGTTYSPANVGSLFTTAPLDLPPDLMSQANPAPPIGPLIMPDPLIGTWKFNPAKSTSTEPLSRSLTLTITREGQNMVNTAEGADAKGQTFKFVYQHIYDGQPHTTTGNPAYDATAFTRIVNTINAVRFRNGKTVAVGQGVIVPGKTYTFNEEGIGPSNEPYHYLFVYERQ